MSSVDYYGCCGAGHRLQRTSLAHYASQRGGFAFRVHWGFCGNDTEVYDYLFGPQPIQELQHLTLSSSKQHHTIVFRNEVPNFKPQRRPGEAWQCQTSHYKLAKHVSQYYESLRNRFRFREKVQEFRDRYFGTNATIISMHIRAGNGETGDFTRKFRGIDHLEEWLQRVVDRILEQTTWFSSNNNAVLFLATDTHAVVTALQTILHNNASTHNNITLVYQNQDRPANGTGVWFGEGNKVLKQGDGCLVGWESAFVDMMLLSHADVLVAPRYSSFTVTLPMYLLLFQQNKRRINRPYCELDREANDMQCYHDFPDWCANGTTRVNGDWMHHPPDIVNFTDTTMWGPLQHRKRLGTKPAYHSIPYNWTEWLLLQQGQQANRG